MRILLLALLLSSHLSSAGLAQEAGRPTTALKLEEVVKMTQAGITEELVIARIKRFNKPFDLSSAEIVELKQQGVSETVIGFLLDPSKPYTPPPPPPPPKPDSPERPKEPPKDPLAEKVPPDPGVYWLASAARGKERFELIEVKSLVPMRSGSKIGSILTGGLKKGQTVGLLVGAASKLRISGGANVFYARIGATAMDDVVLLRAAKAEGGRIVDFGPKPAKPVFPPDSIQPFTSKPIGAGLHRLDVAPMPSGEYLFLILGSGDEKKGILGKGYDFGVDGSGK